MTQFPARFLKQTWPKYFRKVDSSSFVFDQPVVIMGVRGLSSFINKNPKFVSSFQLHDTKIVIDGLNLMHYLYFVSDLSIVYSGDYDKFANVIRDYFNNQKECNIEAIVVLDGGGDPSDRKLNRLVERYRKNLNSAYRISKKGEINVQLLPLLCSTVFLEILSELGTTVVRSDFEADEDIAAVANYFNCPLLSNDSDFYLFNVEFGFITLNSLSQQISKAENGKSKYLKCDLFKIDKFLKANPGLSKESYALLGTLIGNDYVSISTFDNFFNKIKLPKQKRGNSGSQTRVKIVGLLSWLKDKTFDQSVELVLQTIKLSERNAIQSIINETILEYQAKSESVILTLKSEKADMSPKFVTKNGKSIPNWFWEHFRKAELSPILLDIITLNRIYLPPQINHPASRTGHICSEKLRLFIYELLLSIEGGSVCINIFDRHLWTLKKIKSLMNFQDLKKLNAIDAPDIFSMPKIEIQVRRKYFLSALESDEFPINDFPNEIQFALVVLNFYLRNSSPMNEDMFNALLMCIILLALVFPIANYHTDGDIKTCAGLKNLNPSQAVTVKEIFSVYFKQPYHSNAKIFRSDLVHLYSEYQSCLYYAFNLNQLLICPLSKPKLSCLNGSFVYNLCIKLQSKADSNQYITGLFPKDSQIATFYKTTKQAFLNTLPGNSVLKKDLKNTLKNKSRSSNEPNSLTTMNNMYKTLPNDI